MYIYTFKNICKCTYHLYTLHLYTCTYLHIYICTCIHIHIFTYVHIYICTYYIFTYNTCIHIHIYIYIYTGERLEVPRFPGAWGNLESLSDRHKHTEGEGAGRMLTFLEYCITRRCCCVDLRCGIQKGGGGGC